MNMQIAGGSSTVSPEFRLRPSLSGHRARGVRGGGGGVAGVQTPAFVERLTALYRTLSICRVSPEFRLRPSLSDADGAGPRPARRRVSPEFRLRPSLSGPGLPGPHRAARGVAGVQTPAFVERPWRSPQRLQTMRVAGVQTPAFVERGAPCSGRTGRTCVAGVQTPAFVERPWRSPQRLQTMRVAGVQTPAFVERRGLRSSTRTFPVSPEFRLRPSLSAGRHP